MTRIRIEQDTAHPEGGFAFIVISNVEQAPDKPVFSIGDPDTGVWLGKAGDWQSDAAVLIRPRACKQEGDKLFLQIGPELVDNIPPRIYRIHVPGLDLSEDISWPALTPAGRSEPPKTRDNSRPARPAGDSPAPKPAPAPVPVSAMWKLILFAAGLLAGGLLSVIFSGNDDLLDIVFWSTPVLWLIAALVSRARDKWKSFLFTSLLAVIFAAGFFLLALLIVNLSTGFDASWNEGLSDAFVFVGVLAFLFVVGALGGMSLGGTKPKSTLFASLFLGLFLSLFFNKYVDAVSIQSYGARWFSLFIGLVAVMLLNDIKLKSALMLSICLLAIWLAAVSYGFSSISEALLITLLILMFPAGYLTCALLRDIKWRALLAGRALVAGCAASVLFYGFTNEPELEHYGYDSASSFSEDLAQVKINGKFGYINKQGESVIPARYDYARSFSEGLARVEINGKYGFINKKGESVIPARYDNAWSFYEGLAGVEINGKYGFINKQGELVIPARYDYAWPFSEGLAQVKINGKWGYINKQGESVIPARYDDTERFSEGLAEVEINGKYGFINKQGESVIPPAQYGNTEPFSEGLARLVINDKWVFINKQGESVIPAWYDYALPFSEGLAGVVINGKWGYINKQGEPVIPARYDYDNAWPFSEGLAEVEINGKYGFINKQGESVIPARYLSAEQFSEGLASVGVLKVSMLRGIERKVGFINKKGEMVIPARFDDVGEFSEGLTIVVINDKWGFINKKGEMVAPPRLSGSP